MYAAKTEMLNWKNMCTPMIIAPLFTIAKTWKQPKPPSIDDWFKKMWYTFICVCVGSVPQLCPTLCDPVDCRLPGSSVHEIFQARILEWVAISYSSGSSQPKDWTHVSCVSCTDRFFTTVPLIFMVYVRILYICVYIYIYIYKMEY